MQVELTDYAFEWAQDYASHVDAFTRRRHQSNDQARNALIGYGGEAAWRQVLDQEFPEWVELRGQSLDEGFNGDRDLTLRTDFTSEVKTVRSEWTPYYIRPSQTNPDAEMHSTLGLYVVCISTRVFDLQGWFTINMFNEKNEWDDLGHPELLEVRAYCGIYHDAQILVDHWHYDKCVVLQQRIRSGS